MPSINSVFYRQGDMLDQVYPRGNPWHLEGSRSLEYDPEKAQSVTQTGARRWGRP